MSSLIVISRGRCSDAESRETEDRLIREMLGEGCQVLVIPHLYDLPSDHPAVERLGNTKDQVLLYSWLAPRAAEWALRRLLGGFSLDESPRVRCFNMAEALNPERVASVGAQEGQGELEDMTEDVAPRWYPVLDYARCTGCGQCAEFCLFGVYSQDDNGAIVATSPDLCKTGCPACARVCPVQAIMFPHYEQDALISGRTAPDATAPASDAIQDALAERQRCGRNDPDDDLKGLVDELSNLDI